MNRSLSAVRRRLASFALLSACVQMGSAMAAEAPTCASGGGKGLAEVNVAALTSDGRLLCFKRRGASRARDIGYISGLSGGDSALIGIDFRVQDGLLYGVGNGGGCTGSTRTPRSPNSSTRCRWR